MPPTDAAMQSASRRAAQMPPFIVMEVLERANALEREGRQIIHLEVGEPDFETPAVARDAGLRAITGGHTHYTHSLGRWELREAIAAWQTRQYGVATSPDQVIVTVGSSGAMLLLFAALLEPGDEVLLTDPCYACYPNFVTTFEGVPVRTPVSERDGFQYDPTHVRHTLTPRTRALILNSPSNPTGTLTTPERMRQLVESVAGRALIISDEVYHGLVYEGRAHSIREIAPDAVVINSFSKLYAMTGWRLGYCVLPSWLVRPVQKLQQNLFISPPDFAQYAALAALQHAEADVERMRQCYDERRRLILARLKGMGLSILTEPLGAFYVFVNVQQFTDDCYAFAFELLEHAGVAVTPGVDFGPGGNGYIRLSYANSLGNIGMGMDRLAEFLRKRR